MLGALKFLRGNFEVLLRTYFCVLIKFCCIAGSRAPGPGLGKCEGAGGPFARVSGSYSSPILSAAINALCGISTCPNWRMRFLPSFCLSSSLRLRLMSPP